MTGHRPQTTAKLRRRRLEERLGVETLPRLTALTAGPGFGKTTLLAQCFDARPAVWHTVSAGDRSLSVLARNVVRKLRLMAPGISPDLVAAVEGARGPDLSADSYRPVAIAAALAEDLDSLLQRDVILVLDDLHELHQGSDSASFLAALCRYVPRRLRVVTASRLPLPFPVSRLAVAGEVEELDAEDLSFTPDEIEELVELVIGKPDRPLAEEIATLAGGWPAAVVLAIQASDQDPSSLHGSLTGRRALFDYLAEEALAGEKPKDIERLRDVALLPWFKTDLLEHLGIAEGMDPVLLAPGAPWITSAPDVPHAWAISPLVREFLVQRYPTTDSDRRNLLIEAAEWYRSDTSFAEALDCLTRVGDAGGTAELLVDSGDRMVAAGLTRQIVDAIDSLPESVVTPELLLMDAEVRQVLGDWEGAMERYRVLVPDEGQIPARLAWRLGFLNHMRGDLSAAMQAYGRAKLGTEDHVSEAALLGWHASAFWLTGERDQAKSLAEAALERARLSGDSRALATAHTVLAMVAALDGDRATNDVHYLKALEHAERGHDVVQTIRIRSNRGSHFLEEGDFEEALAELDIALRLADMTGFELWRAMSLANRAQVNAFLGRLEESIADLTDARAAFRRIGSRLESYPIAHLGDVYAMRGDTAQARASYKEAIKLSDEADLQGLVPALSGLARLTDDPEEAVDLAKRATLVDSVVGWAHALVSAGWAHLHAADPERSVELANEAARVAGERHDLPGLAEALELRAAIPGSDHALESLEEAKAIWAGMSVPIGVARVELALAELVGGSEGASRATLAAETLQRHGASGLALRARAAAESMVSRERELVIKTLGGFEVIVHGEPVMPSVWQSRVAREIVWMLVAARFRPINREVLLDRLWPDDDPAKASNRLSVALTTVRKVFDPNRSHDLDHYLQANRETVGLNSAHLSIDVEEFLDDSKRGRTLFQQGRRDEALAVLNSAEARYVGEFLEEEPYADWAVALREEARSEYMTVASILAEAAESGGDHDLAARRYLRMLERDVYNEPAHLGLVSAMERAGRRGTARRLYGNYVARMAELDVEPEPFPG